MELTGIPHSEEAAQRLSRRTHGADPADNQFFHTLDNNFEVRSEPPELARRPRAEYRAATAEPAARRLAPTATAQRRASGISRRLRRRTSGCASDRGDIRRGSICARRTAAPVRNRTASPQARASWLPPRRCI